MVQMEENDSLLPFLKIAVERQRHFCLGQMWKHFRQTEKTLLMIMNCSCEKNLSRIKMPYIGNDRCYREVVDRLEDHVWFLLCPPMSWSNPGWDTQPNIGPGGFTLTSVLGNVISMCVGVCVCMCGGVNQTVTVKPS